MKNAYEINLLFLLLIGALASKAPINKEFGTKFRTSIPRNLEYWNFIQVTYKEQVVYNDGFGNNFRNNIDYIKIGSNTYKDSDKLAINANEIMEIHFSSPISSLDKFFGYITSFAEGDQNVKYILSVDFTNFDSSSITDIDYMFSGCESLEKINFGNFRATGVQNMINVFENCKALKELDLSKFQTKNVKDITNIFKDCKQLEFLDLSWFDVSSIEKAENAFYSVNNLKYINLYNVQNNEIFQKTISVINEKKNSNSNLTVCQNYDILESVINKCCFNYIETHDCSLDNFIIVEFKETVNYPYGFGYIEYDKAFNPYRSEITSMIFNGDLYDLNQELKISAKKQFLIFFNSTNTTRLERFFDSYDDPNAEKMILLNFTCFNASLIESLGFAFFGLTELKEIDFTNFVAPSLKNMSHAFFHCSSLENIDLSLLGSSSIVSTNRMFTGCSSLKTMILKNMNLSTVEDASYMFYKVNLLQGLNIYDIKLNNISKKEFEELNDIDNLIVCQSQEIINNSKAQYFCSYFDDADFDNKCTNNIVIFYNETVQYPKGFSYDKNGKEITLRSNVAFIYKNDLIFLKNTTLNIEANTSITICFDNPITSLESFCNPDMDLNTPSITFIDFSQFDSSSITNMNSIFYGCSKLTGLNMSNFNM